MQTSATPPSLSRVGSCPGSTHGSGHGSGHGSHGSGSGSSPGGGCSMIGIDNSGMMGGIGVGNSGGLGYIECSHYDRMPLPIPVSIPIIPSLHHSEDEIEPAYATGIIHNYI